MDRHRTRLLVAVGGSALLALVAVVVIFAIGIRQVPDYPTVAERPEPALEGRLAFARWEEVRGQCIHVVEITAGPEPDDAEVTVCDDQFASGGVAPAYTEWFGWDDDGRLVLFQYADRGSVTITVDPDTGEELAREESDGTDWKERPDETLRDDGTRVVTGYDEDGTASVWLRTEGEEDRLLFRDRGPDGYSFWSARWSPRGDFVLIQDSERRCIVISPSGEPRPRLLLRDVDRVAWYQPA